MFSQFWLCSGTDEVSVSYDVLIFEGSIRIVLVKMLNNFSNADKWFLDMFCVSDSTGCLSASTNLFAASKRLSAGVANGVVTFVGKNCAVAHILVPPVLGTKNL